MYVSSRVYQKERSYKAACMYHHAGIYMYHHVLIKRKRSYKDAVCMYHHVFIKKKEVIKLWYAYIIMCLFKGKKLQSCCMYVSSRVHQKERSYKVVVCIYHHVFIKRKEVTKLRYVYIITCLLKGKKL